MKTGLLTAWLLIALVALLMWPGPPHRPFFAVVITGTLIRGLNSAREQLAAGSKRRARGEALFTLICVLALVYICLTYPVPRSIQELEEAARRVTNDGG